MEEAHRRQGHGRGEGVVWVCSSHVRRIVTMAVNLPEKNEGDSIQAKPVNQTQPDHLSNQTYPCWLDRVWLYFY